MFLAFSHLCPVDPGPTWSLQIRGNHLEEIDDGQSERSKTKKAQDDESRGRKHWKSKQRQHLIIQSVASDDIDEKWIDLHQIDISNQKRDHKSILRQNSYKSSRSSNSSGSILQSAYYLTSMLGLFKSANEYSVTEVSEIFIRAVNEKRCKGMFC